MSSLAKLAVPLVGLAVAYQFFLEQLVTRTIGVGRIVEDLNHHGCSSIPELKGCEDVWFHQPSGLLYLACSDPVKRLHWQPTLDFLDSSGRPLDDHLSILDTRASGPWSSRIRKVRPQGFAGNKGDSTYNLHGLDVHVDADGETLRVFLVNHRPPLDKATGALLDAHAHGANSTIELFETTLGSTSMKHVRTYAHPEIRTPNKVAAIDGDSFVFTNDHLRKVGAGRLLEIFSASGDVSYCDAKSCKQAATKLPYPNGLIKGHDNFFYVPSSSDGKIRVMELQADQSLVLLDEIDIGMPIDNLSMDADGNIWAAAFPQLWRFFFLHIRNPFSARAPFTIWKVSLNKDRSAFFGEKYKIEKALENDGTVASGITVAAHDVETNTVFLGGILTDRLPVCKLPVPASG